MCMSLSVSVCVWLSVRGIENEEARREQVREIDAHVFREMTNLALACPEMG